MVSRRDFLLSGSALTVSAAMGCRSCPDMASEKEFVLTPDCKKLFLPWRGLREKVRIWVAGDTHFGMYDDRDREHADQYRRMSWKPDGYSAVAASHKAAFEKMLARAKAEKVDLLLLVGDIISFPSLANVDYVSGQLDVLGDRWMYVAGNHDWHFEGDGGSDLEQRERWIDRRLRRLYRQGDNPIMHSRVVKGIRFVAIDDSAYLIGKEQLEFWKTEADKGEPIVLMMHIPLYVEGWEVFTCGCPFWNAANDPYWEIERRWRWREEGPTAETFAFRDAVLSTPNLIGVFTGHLHRPMCAHVNRQNLFSVAANGDGSFLDVTIG